VNKLATLAPEGKVVGLDYSAASVAVSRDTNADDIAAGRVHIEQGSVAVLPFPGCTFDVVTAVETHYYWPDLPANLREIRRVLKPVGMFTLIAETYRGGPFRLVYGIVMPLLRAAFLSDEEHRDLLTQAQLYLTLRQTSNSQELAKIDPDTGLQEDTGPSRNRFVSVSLQRNFPHGAFYVSYSQADARDLDTGAPVPEAPRMIGTPSPRRIICPLVCSCTGSLSSSKPSHWAMDLMVCPSMKFAGLCSGHSVTIGCHSERTFSSPADTRAKRPKQFRHNPACARSSAWSVFH
jgi:SAM-dependent methyltransferase